MKSITKAIVVLVVCMFAVAAFAENQVGTGSPQAPTYDNGATGTPVGGISKWGATPGTTATTMDSSAYNFTAGQQFNSKWQMVGGNHDLTTNSTSTTRTVVWSNSGGQSTVKASALCAFCHTAHDNESTYPVRTFLWAHAVGTQFTPYNSPTLQSAPATTSQSQTAMCLGCHDGTVAVTSGAYGTLDPAALNELTINSVQLTTGGKLSQGSLIVPLNRTHPVSFTYNGALAAKHQLRVPAGNNSIDGYGIVPLFGPGGDQMECATCHDPHIKTGIMRRQFPTGASQDNGSGSFCLYCHL